jgi:hypothetical protein
MIGAPNRNRTGVFAVRGRRPRPLDDGSDSRNAATPLYIGWGKNQASVRRFVATYAPSTCGADLRVRLKIG